LKLASALSNVNTTLRGFRYRNFPMSSTCPFRDASRPTSSKGPVDLAGAIRRFPLTADRARKPPIIPSGATSAADGDGTRQNTHPYRTVTPKQSGTQQIPIPVANKKPPYPPRSPQSPSCYAHFASPLQPPGGLTAFSALTYISYRSHKVWLPTPNSPKGEPGNPFG
jgi:hypothetical protein